MMTERAVLLNVFGLQEILITGKKQFAETQNTIITQKR